MHVVCQLRAESINLLSPGVIGPFFPVVCSKFFWRKFRADCVCSWNFQMSFTVNRGTGIPAVINTNNRLPNEDIWSQEECHIQQNDWWLCHSLFQSALCWLALVLLYKFLKENYLFTDSWEVTYILFWEFIAFFSPWTALRDLLKIISSF